MKWWPRRLVWSILALSTATLSFSQEIDLDSVTASEELRWGVRAFHNGFFNESILSLNRSLAFDPENVLARFWLGRSYYYSGFEEAALQEWRTILQSEQGTAHLLNFVEIVESRRGLGRELAGDARYVVATEIRGVQGEATLFRGPTSVRPRPDGSFFVVGFANHLVQRVGVNGTVEETLDGGLEGFDRPFDVFEADDGTVFITEFGADRIARCRPDGTKISTFGEPGIGEGQILGPQFIVGDDDGFLYVTDSGNARVAKFDVDGDFILSFGETTRFFRGLRNPVGVAWIRERLYVLDSSTATVEVFDESGNHIETFADLGLQRPEGLSVAPGGVLLIADRRRVIEFDPETELARPIGEGAGSALTFAAVDANGNLLATDFNSDALLVFANIDSLYSGLFVRVDRIDSNAFPDVILDVTVEDRSGRPIVGLGDENFLLTEGRAPVEAPELAVAVDGTTRADIALLVDRSPAMQDHLPRLREALRSTLAVTAENDRRWLVTAGAQPVIDAEPATGDLELIDRAVSAGEYGTDWAFDLGLRLAGSELIRRRGRRAVFYFAAAPLDSSSFSRYGLVELMQYLKNNDVPFYPIYLADGQAIPELEYLARETGGRSASLRQPQGLAPLMEHLRNRVTGRYTFTYTSPTNSDFGRAYIPMEVEAFLLTRSGRDEIGYYAPLQF